MYYTLYRKGQCTNEPLCHLKMTDNTQTTKHFCQHTGIGDIFVVEMTWNRIVVGSYGPVPADDLKPPDTYDCTTRINPWLKIQKDMLVMISKFPSRKL